MIVVADASVAVKWFLFSRPNERDGDAAIEILRRAIEGAVELWQPPHFVAEVAGVLARLQPEEALLNLQDLLQLNFEQVDDESVYALGTHLAVEQNHHLFDTLYHAVALSEPGATLVTADRSYYRTARHLGQIELLAELELP